MIAITGESEIPTGLQDSIMLINWNLGRLFTDLWEQFVARRVILPKAFFESMSQTGCR